MRITVALSKESNEALHTRLGEFTPLVQKNLEGGIYKQLKVVQSRATAYMWEMFKHPTGVLEEGWDPIKTKIESNRVSGILSNSVAWAWRREAGFSKKTDRLGRYYKKDPGIHYGRWALTAQRKAIVEGIMQSINEALAGETTHS